MKARAAKDPKRKSPAPPDEERCEAMLYSAARGATRCTRRAIGVDDEKDERRCALHNTANKRKRYIERDARWAERHRAWESLSTLRILSRRRAETVAQIAVEHDEAERALHRSLGVPHDTPLSKAVDEWNAVKSKLAIAEKVYLEKREVVRSQGRSGTIVGKEKSGG